MSKELWEGFFDGSAVPNPGDMTVGGYLKRVSDNFIAYKYSTPLGYGTNNEAEYKSLIKLCDNIAPLNIENINIYGDSLLVVNQVNGVWKARDARMNALKMQVLQILESVPSWTLSHVKRDMNMEADSLTR